ncbi:MAG TPA: hypothetical protein VMT03_02065 [Polyangia bacterium]|nr:hypothetical protein [Polyangia bacterium]
MRALSPAIIRGTLKAAGLVRSPEWFRPEGPPDPADVPAWLATYFGRVRGPELLPGPVFVVRDDQRIAVACWRPRLKDLIGWWPIPTLPEAKDQGGRARFVEEVIRVSGAQGPDQSPGLALDVPDSQARQNDEWLPIVEALSLAWNRARTACSDRDRLHLRQAREQELRAEAQTVSSDRRAQLLANARKQRYRAKSGEGADERSTHAEGVFFLTMLVSAPGLPPMAIRQLARWLGVLRRPRAAWSPNENSRLRLLVKGRLGPRRPKRPVSMMGEEA